MRVTEGISEFKNSVNYFVSFVIIFCKYVNEFVALVINELFLCNILRNSTYNRV